MKKLQHKYKPFIFTMIMSASLGLLISLIFVLLITGLNEGFFLRWAKSFTLAFVIAFPSSLTLAPLIQKLTSRIVEEG